MIRHQNLTAMRTLALLADTETGSPDWNVIRLRDALREHLRHLIVRAERRRPRRRRAQ